MATGSHSLLNTLLSWWWLALIWGGALLEWAGEKYDLGVRALRRRSKRRHKQKLERLRLELAITQARRAGAAAEPVPGTCVHRKAVPVRNNDGDVLAWLCRSCDTQLPADFSIYREDLQ